MELDLTSFHKAIQSLESALRVYESYAANKNQDSELVQTLKAGVIQNFEFTYELAWKLMKRWLEINVGDNTTNQVFTRRETYRYAAENGLIDDPAKWFNYTETRNITSHTCDEEKANRVLGDAIQFKDDVINLYNALEERN